jgi:Na+/melibiose symporter-like transporter
MGFVKPADDHRAVPADPAEERHLVSGSCNGIRSAHELAGTTLTHPYGQGTIQEHEVTSAEHIGYLLGAPIAGLLIAAFDVGAALWVTVASFAFAALVVGRLVHLPRPRAVATTAERAGLREAIAFIWADPALRALFVFPTVAVLLVGPLAPIVLPVLAREAFGDPVVLGVMVASYGAGGLLGAAGFGMFGSRVPRRRLYIGVFVVWPCTYAGITLVPFLPFTLAMLLTLGAAAGSLVPQQATIRQERSPARLLPRIVGLSTASVPVAAPSASSSPAS